jgi:hypothetical protein
MSTLIGSFCYLTALVINAISTGPEFINYITASVHTTSDRTKSILFISYILVVTCLWCLILVPPNYNLVAYIVNAITILILFISWCFKGQLPTCPPT